MEIFKTFVVLIFVNIFIALHLFIWLVHILIRMPVNVLSMESSFLSASFRLFTLNWLISESSATPNFKNDIENEYSHFGFLTPLRFFIAGVLPLTIALLGLYKKSLSISGFISAFVVGFILTLASYSLSVSLIAFFLVASKATKLGTSYKSVIDKDSERGSQRTLVQVLCNGGIPCELALVYIAEFWSDGNRAYEAPLNFDTDYTASILKMAALGAIACSCGDTLASELAPITTKVWPRLITTGAIVPPGTNGGVTLYGLFFSAVGGLIVGLAYYACTLGVGYMLGNLETFNYDKEWLVLPLATIAGYIGSIIDSILGATLQYTGYDGENGCVVSERGDEIVPVVQRQNFAILNNHAVNLLSALSTAIITPIFAVAFWNIY